MTHQRNDRRQDAIEHAREQVLLRSQQRLHAIALLRSTRHSPHSPPPLEARRTILINDREFHRLRKLTQLLLAHVHEGSDDSDVLLLVHIAGFHGPQNAVVEYGHEE